MAHDEPVASIADVLSADLGVIHEDLVVVVALLTQLLARLPAALDGGRLKVRVGS